MASTDNNDRRTTISGRNASFAAGIILIIGGAILLLDQTLKTGWLNLIVLPCIGLALLSGGVRYHRLSLVIPGGILSGLGVGLFLFFNRSAQLGWFGRVGLLLIGFGCGWGLVFLFSRLIFKTSAWWALVTGVSVAAVGAAFLFSPMNITTFILFISTGVGLALLSWGIFDRLFGLIIPGCLLVSIGPGVYAAWSGLTEPNSLARTGVMLVGFALGWGLITVFSRVVTQNFVWWPLIPGGVLAMVGWGLYIGGNPGNALSFIGNTGSIALIIFGIYLLLLRRGIHN